jgi:hypothetical protein
LGLLNLRQAHLVRLVNRLRHRIRILLLLGQTALVGVVLGLHAGLVGLGVLLLDELLDERQTLAHVLGLGVDCYWLQMVRVKLCRTCGAAASGFRQVPAGGFAG